MTGAKEANFTYQEPPMKSISTTQLRTKSSRRARSVREEKKELLRPRLEWRGYGYTPICKKMEQLEIIFVGYSCYSCSKSELVDATQSLKAPRAKRLIRQ
jgi:hypothetical protein